jgi:hypothetical protein
MEECINTLVEPLFHLFSRAMASSDAIMFLGLAQQFGSKQARFIATEFNWNITRPLRILRLLGVKFET